MQRAITGMRSSALLRNTHTPCQLSSPDRSILARMAHRPHPAVCIVMHMSVVHKATTSPYVCASPPVRSLMGHAWLACSMTALIFSCTRQAAPSPEQYQLPTEGCIASPAWPGGTHKSCGWGEEKCVRTSRLSNPEIPAIVQFTPWPCLPH